MKLQLFFPPVKYSNDLVLDHQITLRELCKRCGVSCRASGEWVNRRVMVTYGKQAEITAKPGSWGDVRIVLPIRSRKERELAALGAMAYALFDVVARESLKGLTRISPPRGRPKKAGRPLSTKERQRRFREAMR